jgi:hypothetical protein
MTVGIEYESAAFDARVMEGVPDHTGEARPQPVDFFAAPPPEIGQVTSAESTLRQGKAPMSPPLRLGIMLAVLAAVALATAQLASNMHRDDRDVLYIAAGLIAAFALWFVWKLTRFVHRCSYVGNSGVALFTVKGSRNAVPRTQMFRFDQAVEVHAAQTRHFVNGVYTHTSYNYSWTSPEGKVIYRLFGKHKGKDKLPKRGDFWHFARAAEIAFSEAVLLRAQEQLQREGSIAFRVDAKRWVRVGPGFLEFHFGGEPTRVTRDEIASVSLASGQFSFKHKDAKWYSRAGKYSFSYGTMANPKVFLFAMEKLMGYRFT